MSGRGHFNRTERTFPPTVTSEPPVLSSGKTRLVKSATDRRVFSTNRETDAHTALTRGLAEYMTGLVGELPGGRRTTLRRVLDHYAEPEEVAEFPTGVVWSPSVGTYDSSRFTPSATSESRVPDGRYIIQATEYKLDLLMEVWATDEKERMALIAAVEDAMVPVDWMFGCRLELPHYFNMRADYQLISMGYEDTAESASRRYRKATFTVASSIPVARLSKLPTLKPRVEVEVEVNSE